MPWRRTGRPQPPDDTTTQKCTPRYRPSANFLSHRPEIGPCHNGPVQPLAGMIAPIPTPFLTSGEVDVPGLRKNIDHWMTTPLAGVVVLGSNGEAPLLDDQESCTVVSTARAAMPADRLLIAGTGRESTQAVIAATRQAAALGADAALVRTPAFFKPQMTSEAFIRHYSAVADASPIPVLLYNVTMYTGVALPVDAIERLATHPNIVGMKESSGDLAQIAEIIARAPARFSLMAGSAQTVFAALCAGCTGAVLAVAAVAPHLCVEMYRLVQDQRWEEARACQRRLAPVARTVGAAHGVPALKAALDVLGLVGGPPRAPLAPVASSVVNTLRAQLGALGLAPAHTSP